MRGWTLGRQRLFKYSHVCSTNAPAVLTERNMSVLSRANILGQTLRRAFSTGVDVKKVGVIGLGLMGHGVAQISAQSGFEVVGLEATDELCARGQSLIDTSLSKVQGRKVAKGKATQEEADEEEAQIRSRLSTSTDIGALADCDLIIEVAWLLLTAGQHYSLSRTHTQRQHTHATRTPHTGDRGGLRSEEPAIRTVGPAMQGGNHICNQHFVAIRHTNG